MTTPESPQVTDEHLGVILDAEGNVTNVIVLPAKDADLGPAWEGNKPKRLTAAQKKNGVGVGWRMVGSKFEDKRPRPEPGPPVEPGTPGGPNPPTP